MKRLYAEGHAILIKVKALVEDKVTKGGIILKDNYTAEQKNHAQHIGTILDMGHDCYNDKTRPWCKIGDEVYFTNNASRAIYDDGMWGTDDIKEHVPPSLRLVSDLDILGVYRDDQEILSQLKNQKRG